MRVPLIVHVSLSTQRVAGCNVTLAYEYVARCGASSCHKLRLEFTKVQNKWHDNNKMRATVCCVAENKNEKYENTKQRLKSV